MPFNDTLEDLQKSCTNNTFCQYQNGTWFKQDIMSEPVDYWGPVRFAVGVAGVGIAIVTPVIQKCLEWIWHEYWLSKTSLTITRTENALAQVDNNTAKISAKIKVLNLTEVTFIREILDKLLIIENKIDNNQDDTFIREVLDELLIVKNNIDISQESTSSNQYNSFSQSQDEQ